MNNASQLPLFPLDMVLLPYRRVPLHIFEERYKTLIGECLENKTEFGMVWGTNENSREIGCAARVTDLINQFPDGRMNIMIQGTRRIRILERIDGIHPYIVSMVEEIEDRPEALDLELGNQVQILYKEALKLSVGWLTPSSEGEDLQKLAFRVAASLSLSNADQQALLEMRSPNERLSKVKSILEEAVEKIREVKRRTGGNGHLA